MRPTSWISGLAVVTLFACGSNIDVRGHGGAASEQGGAGGAPQNAAGAQSRGEAGAPQVVPGSQGAPCIAATGAGSDDSSSAKDPPSCNDGLVCGTDGICGAMGPCSDVDGQVPCILYDGKAGTDIRDFAVDAKNLYWVEYGAFDELDNYATPGVLKSAPLRGGPAKVVAKNLPGPIEVIVTEGAAFVSLDQVLGPKAQLLPGIGRIPRADSELEILGTSSKRSAFNYLTSFDDTAYWVESHSSATGTSSYNIYAGADEGEPTLIASGDGSIAGLAATDTDLFWNGTNGLWRVPREGGDTEQLAKDSPGSDLRVWGEYAYVLDSEEISRLATDGSGAWQTMYRTRKGRWGGGFTIENGRHGFYEYDNACEHSSLLTGSIEPFAEPRGFEISLSSRDCTAIFALGPDGAYWVKGTRIYFAPFSAFRSTASLPDTSGA